MEEATALTDPDPARAERAAPSPEEILRSCVVPVLQRLGEFAAETLNIDITVALNGAPLLAAAAGKGRIHDCAATQAIPQGPALTGIAAGARSADLDLVASQRERFAHGRVTACPHGFSVFRKVAWIPSMGWLSIAGCSALMLTPRGAATRALNETAALAVDLCHLLVEWRGREESLVHEITTAAEVCVASAERLDALGKLPPETLGEVERREMAARAVSIAQEMELSAAVLDNMLGRFSSAASSMAPAPGGADAVGAAERAPLLEEVRRAAERFAGRAAREGLEVRTDIDVGYEIDVLADRGELRRLLYNLIGNAVKHSHRPVHATDDAGAPERCVRVFARDPDSADGRRAAIVIENCGIGLLPGEESLIMLPGYRGVLAQRAGRPGAGLGLSEARRIADRLGAHLTVRAVRVAEAMSAPTRFTAKVSFPVLERRRS